MGGEPAAAAPRASMSVGRSLEVGRKPACKHRWHQHTAPNACMALLLAWAWQWACTAAPACGPCTGQSAQSLCHGLAAHTVMTLLLHPQISSTPDVCMEMLVDKLKLLDYERDFCKKKKPYRKPLSRLYFAVPDSGTNQTGQFFYFTSLVRGLGW